MKSGEIVQKDNVTAMLTEDSKTESQIKEEQGFDKATFREKLISFRKLTNILQNLTAPIQRYAFEKDNIEKIDSNYKEIFDEYSEKYEEILADLTKHEQARKVAKAFFIHKKFGHNDLAKKLSITAIVGGLAAAAATFVGVYVAVEMIPLVLLVASIPFTKRLVNNIIDIYHSANHEKYEKRAKEIGQIFPQLLAETQPENTKVIEHKENSNVQETSWAKGLVPSPSFGSGATKIGDHRARANNSKNQTLTIEQ